MWTFIPPSLVQITFAFQLSSLPTDTHQSLEGCSYWTTASRIPNLQRMSCSQECHVLKLLIHNLLACQVLIVHSPPKSVTTSE